jgi:hypothetical protein
VQASPGSSGGASQLTSFSVSWWPSSASSGPTTTSRLSGRIATTYIGSGKPPGSPRRDGEPGEAAVSPMRSVVVQGPHEAGASGKMALQHGDVVVVRRSRSPPTPACSPWRDRGACRGAGLALVEVPRASASAPQPRDRSQRVALVWPGRYWVQGAFRAIVVPGGDVGQSSASAWPRSRNFVKELQRTHGIGVRPGRTRTSSG